LRRADRPELGRVGGGCAAGRGAYFGQHGRDVMIDGPLGQPGTAIDALRNHRIGGKIVLLID
jgi:hypothetical protein